MKETCPHCGKTFSKKSNLSNHLRVTEQRRGCPVLRGAGGVARGFSAQIKNKGSGNSSVQVKKGAGDFLVQVKKGAMDSSVLVNRGAGNSSVHLKKETGNSSVQVLVLGNVPDAFSRIP